MIGGLFKSASRVAIVAAAGILAGGVAAQAADLGGNCCADLEERVAELEATTARKGNRKVSLTVYGMVTKSILWHNDDLGYRPDELSFRDYGPSMSRFGFRGEAAIRPDLNAGYVLEFGLTGEDHGVGSASDPIQIRHSYVYLDHASLGRVSLGQQSTATDGAWQVSLANTMVLQGEMNEEGGMLSGPFRNTFASDFDGHRYQGIFYRSPSLAGFMLTAGYFTNTYQSDKTFPYDPDDANDAWDIALRYAGEFNGIRIAAAVGYREEFDNGGGAAPQTYFGDHQIWMGSASVMHMPTGLFVSGGYADRESELVENRKNAWWLQAGIEKNWLGYGNTTIYGEYAEFDYDDNAAGQGAWVNPPGPNNSFWAHDPASDRLDGNYWGLGLVQSIDSAATDLFINFRRYDVDGASTSYQCQFGGPNCSTIVDAPSRDVDVIQAGMRIQF